MNDYFKTVLGLIFNLFVELLLFNFVAGGQHQPSFHSLEFTARHGAGYNLIYYFYPLQVY